MSGLFTFWRNPLELPLKDISHEVISLADVRFPDSPHGGFKYRIPKILAWIKPGIRVIVPFGPKRRTGFLVDIFQDADKENYRDILAAIDLSPILSSEILKLTRWIADYYLCDWGEAISASIPLNLKPRNRTAYRLTEKCLAQNWLAGETGQAAALIRELSQKPLSVKQLKHRFKDAQSLIDRFRSRGWVEAVDIPKAPLKPKLDIRWTWLDRITIDEAVQELPKNAVKMLRTLELIRETKGVFLQREMIKRVKGISSALRSLEKRGWLTSESVARDHLSSMQRGLDETASGKPVLTSAQKEVLHRIGKVLDDKKHRTFLLHGVTGSGKTIVYLEAVSDILARGRKAIVMVPEISLTPQLIGRFKRRFGDRVVLSHSGLTNAERRDVWQAVKSGFARIIVGPRSVVFAPIDNLGLIIVDEEHDESYKQTSPAPRYNGRDVAIYRAMLSNAVALLGSATPDTSSYFNALEGRYDLLELTERYSGVNLPGVWVTKWGVGGEGAMFHPQLVKKVKERLEFGEQVILLLNRRGFSSCIRCPDCGETARCPNCDIALRYHRVGLTLQCHYCGFSQKAFDLCPNCRSHRLRYNGIGTQQAEKEIKRLFPDTRIERMDQDTTRQVGAHQQILSKFSRHEFDILLGTKMVAKGHDFPGVNLVGIVAADFEWLHPDFRALERAFRLLVQASGRTGRNTSGEVVIQTWNPAYPMLRWVQKHDYKSFYDAEIVPRKKLLYPPFSRLVAIMLTAESMEIAKDAADNMKERMKELITSGVILGPAPPPIERVEKRYRQRILLKLPRRMIAAVQKEKEDLQRLAEATCKNYKKAELKVIIDVDPLEA